MVRYIEWDNPAMQWHAHHLKHTSSAYCQHHIFLIYPLLHYVYPARRQMNCCWIHKVSFKQAPVYRRWTSYVAVGVSLPPTCWINVFDTALYLVQCTLCILYTHSTYIFFSFLGTLKSMLFAVRTLVVVPIVIITLLVSNTLLCMSVG